MKIYTRRGDAGQTDLFGGERVGKDAERVAAYGDVDELNATVGMAAASGSDPKLADALQTIQSALFDLGASLATPSASHREKAGVGGVNAEDIASLETLIDSLEEHLPPLTTFILPGGTPSAAAFHVARTVCRRAERAVVHLAGDPDESVEESSLQYLNRLSDLLFVIARHENARQEVADVAWVNRGTE
ncbi:MAG: cob(I)yrinic acid a,c-diamide adenosyltransferase [Myxococcota bacterium]